MAARRRREPTGRRPWVRNKMRSSRGLDTVVGSKEGNGGVGREEDVEGASTTDSLRFEVDVLKL